MVVLIPATGEFHASREHRQGHNAAERFCKDRCTPGRCEQSSASANVGGCTRPFVEGYPFGSPKLPIGLSRDLLAHWSPHHSGLIVPVACYFAQARNTSS